MQPPSHVHIDESQNSSKYALPPSSIMGPDINIDSILVLEKQIQEDTGDIIQLKRARNSLLNISARVPPEILGRIFRWNVIPEGDFGGLSKGSYNFLLVCHHWFQVASSTPELWTFWGNTLDQWSRRYQRSGIAPLDLVLNVPYHLRDANPVSFDGPLRDALRDRVASDSIRSIHLQGLGGDLLYSVISSLTLDGNDIRYNSIESLILESTDLDISNFLARYRFPKLRDLRLSTIARISSWDYLKLQAASLTTLSLEFTAISSTPTSSQLHSILASYPNLQNLSLCESMIPNHVGDGPVFRAPLRCLKRLYLRGGCRHVFRLLDQLEYPDTLDHVSLGLLECVAESISGSLAPYLQDRIRRDHRFQDRLEIHASSIPNCISFKFNVVGESDASTTPSRWHRTPSVSFRALFSEAMPQRAGEVLCVSLITLIPQEHVVGFTGRLSTRAMTDLAATMPNIEDLYLTGLVISDTFLRPDPPSRTKLLPSLRRLSLGYLTLQNDDWTPLINYLTHQTSGGQVISLRLCGGRNLVPPDVAREIEKLVQEFNLGYPSTW